MIPRKALVFHLKKKNLSIWRGYLEIKRKINYDSHKKGRIKVKPSYQCYQLEKGHRKLKDEFRTVSKNII